MQAAQSAFYFTGRVCPSPPDGARQIVRIRTKFQCRKIGSELKKPESKVAGRAAICTSEQRRNTGRALAVAEQVGQFSMASKTDRKLGGVFFDLDDTLVLTHEADSVAHSAVLELVAAKYPKVARSVVLRSFIKKFVAQAWDPENKVDVTEWRATLWHQALQEQGVVNMELAREMQSCFDRERLRAFRWASGVEALVKKLQGRGIKVGVITNGHPVVQRAKLQACRASELFDTILVGGEEPKAKPHKDIFLKACHIAGCKPQESIMVGDTLTTDILGGINTGFLSTVWVNLHKEELPKNGPKPDHVISNIGELKKVLEQLGVPESEV
ncbi:putative hydrolase of the HAD superfamily [Marchantia polymorpha subsp. ruderalis]|uniref:N-acylneuraminate-9-phosphatase n=2 Tax=Marchantia polymorpha TaxID=3197 RepID=A0A176WL70_MARPO|nr:hypothetical protein AXG93_1104s1040 [Marchantia polymorpha subsp. ruderalis]PTQ37897.1 hypothetical protein MARPO_0054s0014 [Marchantia polymorpha]BBN08911.1 hypothetical protein Mp_4g15490 [Marchantia polymorpha subsp. ruderalis]|eukprot:PTQ37897.1 hypothetical protein MARPO_0054s0014 [Marchantia polymorpha]